MLQILVFGQLTDVFGKSEINLDFVPKVIDIKSSLIQSYPALKEKTYVVAVNNKVVDDQTEINDGSTIALLPPFSGG
ncbi:MAG: hypothetical protein RLZZ546_1679 [Bacteroidota bacterium]|jgi:molybdopterin converting factor small subunit